MNGGFPEGMLRRYGLPAVALVLALLIFVTHANRALFLVFNELGSHTGDGLWANWTLLGDALVLLSLSLLFVGRYPGLVWSLLLTALLAGMVVPLLKQVFGLPRPPAVLSPEVLHVIGRAYKSGSFPSGHTAAAFAFAGVLSLYFRSARIMAAAVAVAVGVGVSRMAVGVHWPLDVTAGAAVGWLSAVAGTWSARRWRWGESVTGQRVVAAFLLLCALLLLFSFKADSPRAALLPKGIAIVVLLGALPALGRLWRRGGAS